MVTVWSGSRTLKLECKGFWHLVIYLLKLILVLDLVAFFGVGCFLLQGVRGLTLLQKYCVKD